MKEKVGKLNYPTFPNFLTILEMSIMNDTVCIRYTKHLIKGHNFQKLIKLKLSANMHIYIFVYNNKRTRIFRYMNQYYEHLRYTLCPS